MTDLKPRLYYIDNLKALLIMFVVLMHSACTYSGLGFWFFKQSLPQTPIDFYAFAIYQSFSQAYFMALYFFIAGYFVPKSLQRKGVLLFIKDRLFRLGLPTLIFILILNPLCFKLSHPAIDLKAHFIAGLSNLSILGWSGPLWFALALLIFSIIYSFVAPKLTWLLRYQYKISLVNVVGLIIIISIGAFLLRLVFPLGTAVLNFQLGNFSAYIVAFILGTIFAQKNLLPTISIKHAVWSLVAALFLGIPLWFWILHSIVSFDPITMQPLLSFSSISGSNIHALLYAFWESLFCVSFSLALLGGFQYFFNSQRPWQKFLADNGFGVYTFHSPVLIATSLLMLDVLNDIPLVKWLLVGIIAIIGSYLVSAIVRTNRLLHKIFT